MSTLMKDLREAFASLDDHYQGKITLRSMNVPAGKKVTLSKTRIRRIRAATQTSQEVFARILNLPKRTLEKWEQGASHPTGAATTLLILVEKHPDLLLELAESR